MNVNFQETYKLVKGFRDQLSGLSSLEKIRILQSALERGVLTTELGYIGLSRTSLRGMEKHGEVVRDQVRLPNGVIMNRYFVKDMLDAKA